LVSSLASAEQLVSLATRDGVTQSYLLVTPEDKAEAVAVLFPGGGGNIRLRLEKGVLKFGPNNFLVRSRGEFVRNGIAVAIIDAPSDQHLGMSDEFRSSADHVNDIDTIIQDLKARFPARAVYLVGTSRGTVSAAYVGSALGSRIDGTILTSAVYLQAGGGRKGTKAGLSGFDFGTIRSRVLLVHHLHDGCFVTPFREANRLADRFPLITVRGGNPPESGPCEALSEHGFFGREPQTVDAIAGWMLGKAFRKEVD